MDWQPDLYARFAAERARPFYDMLARVRRPHVATAVDLGCGSGNLTREIAERWPEARVLGVDSSPEMLARARPIPGRLTFLHGDIAKWAPDAPVDLLLSNAALHWVPDHPALLARLVAALAPGGTLAVQMPDNFDAPTHTALTGTAETPRWRGKLGPVSAARRRPIASPHWYAEWLLDAGLRVEAWTTTYYHVVPGPDAVLDWIRGTAMRPFLAPLDEDEAAAYTDEVRERLRQAYPERESGTLLPYSRMFFVAERSGTREAPAEGGRCNAIGGRRI